MRPKTLLVDRKIVEERQQDGRNDAVRQILGVAGHVAALLYRRVFHTTYITPAPTFGMTRPMNQTQSQAQSLNTQTPSVNGDLFFENWATPDAVPPFDRVVPGQFLPAYARALAEHEAEIAAIAANPEPPSFDNTIAAMERSGRALDRVGNVFHLLAGAHTNDALLEIEREISPKLARH